MISISDEQELAKVFSNHVTAAVFAYIKKQNRPIGVREIQRELGLSNPSSAYWHLNKLRDSHILDQNGKNQYYITDEYQNIRKIPVPIVLDHYIMGNMAIPGIIMEAVFQITNFIVILVAIFLGMWLFAAILGCISLFLEIILRFRFLRKLNFKKINSNHGNSGN